MGLRNRFEIGRFVAILLAAVITALLPLRMLIGQSAAGTDKNISLLLDGFTSNAGQKRRISSDDYEKMLSGLKTFGSGFEVSISIEREAESLAYKALRTAAHVHGPECYAGHNHKACGCRFHTHTSACRCQGTYRKYSYTEDGTSVCYKCMGTGKTGNIETCPACKGKEPDWTPVPCPSCNGEGIGLYKVWHVCPNCDGAGCNICDEGKPGGWYKEEYDTCRGCRGRGTVLDRIPCSTCNGRGTIGEIKTCSSCSGRGYRESSTVHYTCDSCGSGDSAAYGSACGRLVCGMDFESYECGVTNEDNSPRCDRIIVDAEYQQVCHIRQFDTPDMVDTVIGFTFLNGDRKDIRTGLVRGTDDFDSSKPGTLELCLSYTGYFETADNYETRLFPIRVEVDRTAAVCEKCGKTYYIDGNGKDPGCPYCAEEDFTIRVSVNGEVIKGGIPRIDVYKVGREGEVLISKDDYTLFYDTDSLGENEAALYYSGCWEYFTISVVPDPDEVIFSDDGENTGGNDHGDVWPGGSDGNQGSGTHEGDGGDPGNAGGSSGNNSGSGGNSNGGNSNGGSGSGSDANGADAGVIQWVAPGTEDGTVPGKYVHIPDEEIISIISMNGSFELREGDLLNVTVTVNGKNTFDRILKVLFIPERIKDRYTSGIIV